METLGGWRTHHDHSVYRDPGHSPNRSGDGCVSQPGHGNLVLRLCWVLLRRRLQLVKIVYQPRSAGDCHRRTPILRMKLANTEGHRSWEMDKLWWYSFSPSISWFQNPRTTSRFTWVYIALSPPSLFVFLPWVNLAGAFCHLYLIDVQADYTFFSLVNLRISKCSKVEIIKVSLYS